QAHHLRAAGAEPHGLPRLRLGQPPDLRIVERTMLDLAGDAWPPPGRVDLIQQRARRIAQPRAARLLGLQMIAVKPCPPLNGIVMPASAGEILVAVIIAMREDVESRPLLIADDD